MPLVQQVNVKITDGRQVTFYIVELLSDTKFTADLYLPPMEDDIMTKIVFSGIADYTAAQAYEDVIEYIARFAKNQGRVIIRINNPCNVPFVSKKDQIIILSRLRQMATVLVNGLSE